MIASEAKDLWTIVWDHQHLDPIDLTRAIEDQVASGDLDYRTRLLIRESMDAVSAYWGTARFQTWLSKSRVRRELEAILQEQFDDDVKFPSIKRRVMDVTRPETVRAYLRDLSTHVHRPVRLNVGGSVACILAGYLSKKTEDIDVVDEVPPEIRSKHQVLADLFNRYDLELGHFQSHYLPSGWEQRIHTQAPFGQLQVCLVDVHDVFLSKLFSSREKDRDDLERLKAQLDKEVLVDRLKHHGNSLIAVPDLKEKAEKNWYILYGEPLPT